MFRPIGNHGSSAAGASPARPGNALFNDVPTQISIDRTMFSAVNCLAQTSFVQALLAGEACEHLRYKDPHTPSTV